MTNSNNSLLEEIDPFAVSAAVEVAATAAQADMWLREKQSDGARCIHNRSFSIRLQGQVSDSALEQALRMLPDFHEALRGHFSDDGQRFIIDPYAEVSVARHDLSVAHGPELDRQLMALVHQDSANPYDLMKGPLFRAAIVTVDAQTRVVLLSVHEAVCDGWSLDVLLADFARLYSAVVGAAPLPDPPKHSFSDFVRYSESEAARAKKETNRAFWRKAFADRPSSRSLFEQVSGAVVRTFGANYAVTTISRSLLDEMRAFAKRNQVSLFTVLFSGYTAFLRLLADTPDVVVGVSVAGHPDADMEDCVGHLANLLPVRLRFADGDSFGSVCKQAAAALLDARENATVGCAEIAKDLRLPSQSARMPLAPATFTHVQRYASGKLTFAGCTVDYAINPRAFDGFDLSLNAIESKEGVQLIAHASADLFSQEALSSRLGELARFFGALIQDSQSPLRTLPALPKRSSLESDGNGSAAVNKPAPTLADFFERGAGPAETPHVGRSLPTETVNLMRAIARSFNVSVFSVLYATYAARLARSVRRDDTLVGLPVATDVAGRHTVRQEQSFVSLARQAHSVLASAQNKTVDGVVAAFARSNSDASVLSLVGSLSYLPYLPSHDASRTALSRDRLDHSLFRSAEHDLVHVVAFESDDAVTLEAHAETGDVDEARLARFLAEFETLLRKACDHPTASAMQLSDAGALAAGMEGSTARRDSSTECRISEPDENLSDAPIVVTLREGSPERTPLLCILGIQLYIDLAMVMTDGTPVVGLHCPMYYTPGETPRPSLAQVANRYVETIRERYPKGPYKLLGLCFGGVVAYEVAKLLIATGEEVQLVAVLDIPLPSALRTNWTKRTMVLGRELLASPRTEVKRLAGVLTRPAIGRLVRTGAVLDLLADAGFTPTRHEPVDLPVLGAAAKSDVAAFAKEKGTIATRLLVFRALDSEIPEWVDLDSDMGWSKKATSFCAYTIECDHMQIVRRPHCNEVAAILMRELEAHKGV